MSENFLKYKMSAVSFAFAILPACHSNNVNETAALRDVLERKAGLYLVDTITIISKNNGGFDLQGTMAKNYRLAISEYDLQNVIDQIEEDTVFDWAETGNGDYVITIRAENSSDTAFGIGIIKTKSVIDINIEQGF